MSTVLAVAWMAAPAGAQQATDDQYGTVGPSQVVLTEAGDENEGSGGGREAGRGQEPSREAAAGRGGADRSGDDSAGSAGDGRRERRIAGAALPLKEAEGGSLPFTGLDVSLLAMLGIALLSGGLAVRAAARLRAKPGASG